MSAQSDREWKKYRLTKGVFGNALRFGLMQKSAQIQLPTSETNTKSTKPNSDGSGGYYKPLRGLGIKIPKK